MNSRWSSHPEVGDSSPRQSKSLVPTYVHSDKLTVGDNDKHLCL
jgi:hypothetical protein